MVELSPMLQIISPNLTEVYWDSPITDELLGRKISIFSELKKRFSNSIEDIRTGFRTITIQWNGPDSNLELQESLKNMDLTSSPLPSKIWEIPVCYESEFGVDLARLAKMKSMTKQEIIECHSAPAYRIHFIGFLPGFPYLSGLDLKLATPRKSHPDRAVAAGSVAIGGEQAGIYPQQSPGGWHVIGRTPIQIFNPNSTPPVPFSMGERLKFKPISIEEFRKIKDSTSQIPQ